MSEMRFSITIKRASRTVFELIADLASYHQWLAASNLYTTVIDVSDNPVSIGTTYIERGPETIMRGEVTEYQPYTHITFRQFAQMKLLAFPMNIVLQIRYSLERVEDATIVVRYVSIQPQGALALMQPMLLKAIRQENRRILQAMKTYLEAVV